MESRTRRLWLAAAVVLAPLVARAETFDVCGNPVTDFRAAGQSFVFVGMVLAGGTIPDGGVPAGNCPSVAAARVGTIFAQGNLVSGFPNAAADDVSYEDWHLRIDGRGAIDTTGPVKSPGPYRQTIVGGTGEFRGFDGGANVSVLDGVGFQFRMTLPSDGS